MGLNPVLWSAYTPNGREALLWGANPSLNLHIGGTHNVPVNEQGSNQGLIVAALFALVTDWDEQETRQGRRGEYRTTGASMFRIRTLQEDEADSIKAIAGTFGLDLDDDELQEIFSGDYEYQISYACNRFESKTGGIAGGRLTQNEMRTLERAKTILLNKEAAATRILTTPDVRRDEDDRGGGRKAA